MRKTKLGRPKFTNRGQVRTHRYEGVLNNDENAALDRIRRRWGCGKSESIRRLILAADARHSAVKSAAGTVDLSKLKSNVRRK